MPSLIFFASLLIFLMHNGSGCVSRDPQTTQLIYSGKKATGIAISLDYLVMAGAQQNMLADTGYLHNALSVRAEKSETAILGTVIPGVNQVVFEPAIPFLPGKKFEVYLDKKPITAFTVPMPDKTAAAVVEKTYPTTDTVPENLLKIYVSFSASMREGVSLRNIHLLNEAGDTIRDVFLDLQPELWDPERKVLTVWLDPGRIKRDLIPNLEKGKPLEAGRAYYLNISGDWADAAGLTLKNTYSRRLVVSARDSTIPDVNLWTVRAPAKGTKDPLIISFDEPVDYYLIAESIAIMDSDSAILKGRMTVEKSERGLSFYPASPWKGNQYTIRVAAKLEDLAGNNLNRPFDNDALANKSRNYDFYLLTFRIP